MSLKNIDKFVDFLGADWVKNNSETYQRNQSNAHPFIVEYSKIINSEKTRELIKNLPKDIKMNYSLKPYLLFDFLGKLIEKIESNLPNPQKFKNRLKNRFEYETAVYELLCCAILIHNGYFPKWLKTTKNNNTPDFEVNNEKERFTVEVTTKNVSKMMAQEEIYAQLLMKNIEKYSERKNLTFQLYITTKSISYKEEIQSLIQLCKEVIDRGISGEYLYYENKICISLINFDKSEKCYPSVDEFFRQNSSLKFLPNNCGYDQTFSFCKKNENETAFKNIIEVAVNHEIEIHKNIHSSLKNKIKKNQHIPNTPHLLMMVLPQHVSFHQNIDINLLEKQTKMILKEHVPKINYVVFIREQFGEYEKRTWGYDFQVSLVKNEESDLSFPVSNFHLKSFDKSITKISDQEQQYVD